jgi:hypothetical protein
LIPPLNEHGYLPAGVHPATLEEVIERFGYGSEQREAEADSLRWLVPLCRQIGITKLLINGSFVTGAAEPNDVDCVLLLPADYDESTSAAQRLLNGLPFLEIKLATDVEYTWFASVMYASDRGMIEKGVVEVTP